MKVFFDTNVYVAEALLGHAATTIISSTQSAGWRIFCCEYVIDELVRVLTQYRHLPPRFASRTQRHVRRRCQFVDVPTSSHHVDSDPNDSPILSAAVTSGADWLVTNDAHLLRMNPYEGLRIISMNAYYDLLVHEGLLK